METSEEEFVSEEEADGGPAALKSLRERLKKAVEEKQEYLEGWQRSRADFANYKREEASLLLDKEGRLKAELVEALLPTLDTLELAIRHNNDETLRMLQKQFDQSLKKVGVERFGEKGEEFDPTKHEALAKHSEDHLVTDVQRSGYKINDHIIRPAQVII
ncbi:MAG: nucleotide exchange factor GrpE [Patescibacteria group bacterium]